MAVRPIQSRLFGGRSTPAMRAMLFLPASLTLALAVLCVRTDHAHYSAPMNHFALHANFLYRCSYLHFDSVLPCPTCPTTCSDTQSARASDRRAKVQPLRGHPEECG